MIVDNFVHIGKILNAIMRTNTEVIILKKSIYKANNKNTELDGSLKLN